MIRNKKLKRYLQSLVQSAFSIYRENTPSEEKFRNNLLHINIETSKLDPKVIEIKEYSTCVDLMRKDENIKALQGELVGTNAGSSIVENEEKCILSFIKQLYTKNSEYTQIIFDQQYLSFEELFYSDNLRFEDSVRLHNFQFSGNEIELAQELNIKKETTLNSPQEDFTEHFHRPYISISRSNFTIERVYSRKKIVGTKSKKDNEKVLKELAETGELFDLVIIALRILKSSAVYRDNKIETRSITFQPQSGITTRAPFFENIVIGEECNVEEEDIDNLKKIFVFLVNNRNSRFIVAQRRLSLGIERKGLEDRIIDYMVGLEALYLPDGNQELSFRLSLRVAFILFSDSSIRKENYYFLKEMYKIRSNIVHGSNYNLNEEQVKKVEDLLRRSLKLWIKDKNNFSVNKFSNSGIIKSEGKLENIFFDN